MYHIKLENEKNQILDFNNENIYQVYNIQGLASPDIDIISDQTTLKDGFLYRDYGVQDREISFEIKVNGNVETNRHYLYNFLRGGKKIRLYIKTTSRNVYIDGHLSKIDFDLFAKSQVVSVSILCSYPYFTSYVENGVNLKNVVSLFEFPFSINAAGIPFSQINYNTSEIVNNGQKEVGAIFTLTAQNENVVNPYIKNLTTKETMTLLYTLEVGQTIIIDTRPTKKSITIFDGVEKSNGLKYLKNDSLFISLDIGENIIDYGVYINFERKNLNLNVGIAWATEFEAI